MSISFSGLGGSGKSTQISKLRDFFVAHNYRVSVVSLRDKFLWPKLAEVIRKSNPSTGREMEKRKASKITARYVLRHLFYFFDFWRVYIFFILPKIFKSDIVFIDRSFLDFFVELDLVYGEPTKLTKFLFRLLPSFTLFLFFDITAEVSYGRKIESSLESVKKQCLMYSNAINKLVRNNVFRVDAKDSAEEIFHVLSNILLDSLRSGVHSIKFRFFNYFLFKNNLTIDRAVVDKVVGWNVDDFFNYASINRFLWLVLDDLVKLGEDVETFSKIKDKGGRILAQKNNTREIVLSALSEVGNTRCLIVKDSNVEVSQDVDVMCLDHESYKKVQGLLAFKLDAEVKDISKIKSDLVPKNSNFLSVDLHCGYTFYSRKYFDDNLFLTHTPEADILSVISHSVAEMTVITLGDVIKVTRIIENSSLDWSVIFSQTRKYGWHNLCLLWLVVCAAPEDFVFPYNISGLKLFFDKLSNFSKSTLVGYFNFFRAIRARRMGQVPFHPSWYK